MEGLRASLLLLAVPIAFVIAAWLLGARLPEAHTAVATGLVDAPPDRVWELLTDLAAQSTWRREGPVRILRGGFDPVTGDACWTESWIMARLSLCATSTGRSRRIIRTVDPTQPFDATWTYDLSPAPNGQTNLTITETSLIRRPLWRFLGRYILRRDTANAFYLAQLQREAVHRFPSGPSS